MQMCRNLEDLMCLMNFRYPKDAEKHLLAMKSGLTRTQVIACGVFGDFKFKEKLVHSHLGNRKHIFEQQVKVTLLVISFLPRNLSTLIIMNTFLSHSIVLGIKLVYKCPCSTMETNDRRNVQRSQQKKGSGKQGRN